MAKQGNKGSFGALAYVIAYIMIGAFILVFAILKLLFKSLNNIKIANRKRNNDLSKIELDISIYNRYRSSNEIKNIINYFFNDHVYVLIDLMTKEQVLFTTKNKKEEIKTLKVFSKFPKKYQKKFEIKKVKFNELINLDILHQVDYLEYCSNKYQFNMPKKDIEIFIIWFPKNTVNKYDDDKKCLLNFKVNIYENLEESFFDDGKDEGALISKEQLIEKFNNILSINKYAYIEYEFLDDEYEEHYYKLCQGFDSLYSNNKLMYSEVVGAMDYKYNGGAVNKINFKKYKLKYAKKFQSNLIVNQLEVDGFVFIFLPNFVYEIKSKQVIEYTNMIIKYENERIVGNDHPSDSEVVDWTWQYVNKDGSRDKRFNNNSKIDIYTNGRIIIRYNSNQIIIGGSSTKKTEKFYYSLYDYIEYNKNRIIKQKENTTNMNNVKTRG